MSIDELVDVLEPESDRPRLKWRSILHTDSAKAYKKVGPQRWPEPGAHHDSFEGLEVFKKLEYTHTNVTHKRKVGQQTQYAAVREVILPNGEKRQVKGGTQTTDGYWATLRREVGRKGFNTSGSADDPKRHRLHRLVRAHQWSFWNLGDDRFALLGEVFRAQREVENAAAFF